MTAQDLKNSILQQAIQGKLVPQNPSDEPASELLKKIAEERQKLIDEGKIKNVPLLPLIEDNEKPFDIPDSWQWVRLGEIITLISGQDLPLDRHNTKCNGIPYITGASNIVDEKIIINRWTTSPIIIAEAGDILISCKGTVGKIVFLEEPTAHIARQIMAIKFTKTISKFYVKFFIEYNVGKLKNMAKSMIPGISRNNLLTLIIPLPPLAEQKRIVAKLEELMPLIERYDAAEKKLSALDKEFPDKLRKSILQQAIQGKLTEQLSSDGDARDLLEKIRAEKAKLIADGKIKKEKPLPTIKDDEKPFDIPDNWCWCRLDDIGTFISGYTPKSNELTTQGKIPYFKVADMNTAGNEIWLTKTKLYLKNNNARIYEKNIIVYPKNGGAIFTNKKRLLQQDSVVDLNTGGYKAIESLNLMYVFNYFLTIDFRLFYKGTAVPTLDNKQLRELLFPLPPLAEQKRIVAKLNELLPLCDALSKKIRYY